MSNLNLNTISSLDTGREVDVNRVMQSVDYVGGLVIDSLDTIITDGNDRYVLASNTPIPYTTTGSGMPEGGAFVSVGDAALRQDLASQGGAGLVGTTSATGQQTVAEALDERLPVVLSSSFDDLQSAMNYAVGKGLPLHVSPDEVFSYSSIVFPAGVVFTPESEIILEYNGGTFTLPATVMINDNVKILGKLTIKTLGDQGGTGLALAHVTGNEVEIGEFVITDDVLSSEGTAVTIYGQNFKCSVLKSKNFGRPFMFQGADNSPNTGASVDLIDIDTYIRGVSLVFTQGVYFKELKMRGLHPSAKKSPGHNGILISSAVGTRIDYADVADSGEHAFRIGGASGLAGATWTSDVLIKRWVSRSSGGCAFKINPNFDNGGELVKNVTVGEIIAYNTSRGLSGGNAETLRLTQCEDINIGLVYEYWTDRTGRPARNALRINQCRNVNIGTIGADATSNPMLSFNEASDGAVTGCSDITIDNVVFFNRADPTEMIRFDLTDFDLSNITINNITGSGISKAGGLIAWVPGAGSVTGIVSVSGTIADETDVQLTRLAPSTDLAWLDIRKGSRRITAPMYAERASGYNVFYSAPFTNSNTPSQTITAASIDSGIAGQGNYGPYYAFSRVGSNRRGAAIAVRQKTAEVKDTALVFCNAANIGSTDALFENVEMDHNGNVETLRKGSGYILRDDEGSRWRITVDTSGTLQVSPYSG